MPYVIATTNPRLRAAFEEAGGRGVDLAERIDAAESCRAVATLDEASGRVDDAVYRAYNRARRDECDALPPDYFKHSTEARELGEQGGTIGPLPDGTVIEVKSTLLYDLSLVAYGVPASDASDAEIIAAANAKWEAS